MMDRLFKLCVCRRFECVPSVNDKIQWTSHFVHITRKWRIRFMERSMMKGLEEEKSTKKRDKLVTKDVQGLLISSYMVSC